MRNEKVRVFFLNVKFHKNRHKKSHPIKDVNLDNRLLNPCTHSINCHNSITKSDL